ncbi:uncharacterized protein LOC126838842 [Adelges cooleyi]|uniref:uncharacterized protein LOC126838842 n=1 Tax=Adelges cooleyi TaxID=133065 RepID=UPI00217F3440|nr:uncharacterized protein LOC126838842 [Adelges cooleyi]
MDSPIKPSMDYELFMSYLRKAGVWKALARSFKMLNKVCTRSQQPDNPVEFVRKHLMATNSDLEAADQVRQDIAECKKILLILKRDKCVLTRDLNSLHRRLYPKLKSAALATIDTLDLETADENDDDKA